MTPTADSYIFEGPSRTLFVIAGRQTLHILTYDGQEALVAVEDLVGLLLHLSAHKAALSTCRHLRFRRVAAHLRRRLDHRG